VDECREARVRDRGVSSSASRKPRNEEASGAYDRNGIVQRAIRAIKAGSPGPAGLTDVCNCDTRAMDICGKVVNGEGE